MYKHKKLFIVMSVTLTLIVIALIAIIPQIIILLKDGAINA